MIECREHILVNAPECLGFEFIRFVIGCKNLASFFLTNEKPAHTSFPALDACFCSMLLIGSF